MLKKVLSLALACIMTLSLGATAFASNMPSSLTANQAITYSADIHEITIPLSQSEVNELNSLELPEAQYRITPRSIQTVAVKKAIKAALKNERKLIAAIKKYIDADAAEIIGKHLNKINPVLEKLLKYETLAYQTIQDQVSSGLIRAGVKSSTARSIGYWISKAIEWGI